MTSLYRTNISKKLTSLLLNVVTVNVNNSQAPSWSRAVNLTRNIHTNTQTRGCMFALNLILEGNYRKD